MDSKGDLLVNRGYRKNFRQEPMEAFSIINNKKSSQCISEE